MSNENNQAAAGAAGKSKLLGLKELVPIALGTVIGAGIVTIVGPAIAASGISMWLAYLVAIVMGFIAIFPFVILSGVVKMQGGFYSFVLGMLGPKLAGLYALLYIPCAFTFGLYGLAFGSYINSVLPFINPQIAAVFIVFLFCFVNMFGIGGMARLQKPMFWLLILSFVIFIVIGLTKLTANPLDASNPDFLTNGPQGFLQAIILLSYSTTSYYLTANFGGGAANPKKHIPMVLCITPFVLMLLYGGVSIVASSVLPVAEVAGKPLTGVASTVLSTPLFLLFIIGGCLMAIATTLNSVFGAFGVMYKQCARDGWVGGPLAKMNKHDQPVVLMAICGVIGILPILLNLSTAAVTSNLILIQYSMVLIPSVSVFVLPRKYPEAWKVSMFKKWPLPLFYIVVSISVLMFVTICVLSTTNLTVLAVVITLAVMAFCAVYAILRANKGRVNVKENKLEW